MSVEHHQWKLGSSTWASLTIAGPVSRRTMKRLREHIELLLDDDGEEGEAERPATSSEPARLGEGGQQ